MVSLEFSTALSPGLALWDESPFSGICLERLAQLTKLEFPGNLQANAAEKGLCRILPLSSHSRSNLRPLLSWKRLALFRELSDDAAYLKIGKSLLQDMECLSETVWFWRTAVIAAAMDATLKNLNLILLHGALLVSPKGCIALCGPSGIGKSTTCRRWKNAGGVAPADDMLLLERLPDGGYQAHPLPTWSRCMNCLKDEETPFHPSFRLTGVLALGRDEEKEQLRRISRAEHLALVVASCRLFYSSLLENAPDELRKTLQNAIAMRAVQLSEAFAPMALHANLDGDISKTLAPLL